MLAFFMIPGMVRRMSGLCRHHKVSDDVAEFIAQVMTDILNASHVEVLVGSEADNGPVIVTQRLHLASKSVVTTRIRSNASASAFLEHVFAKFSTSTKVYVICLLPQKYYLKHIFPLMESVWTHLVYSYWIVLGRGKMFARLILQQSPCTFYFLTDTTQGYVLQGPSYAKRNNCSGVRTIARWPKLTGATSPMLLPPAKEERSNVLALACDGSENNVKGMYECYSLIEEDGVIMMRTYLNITRFERVTAALPFLPNDRFPQANTLTGLLTHGVSVHS
ncbi:uncharacterized protein [Dermacentor albipictus]|uniref:uncharacterized protein n=1 Tax=Dermacentor albipictus TaxID=60249 RepID=UPI0038FBEE69